MPKTKWTRTKKREDYLDVVDDLSETVYTELNERLVAFRGELSFLLQMHLISLCEGRLVEMLN